MDFEFWFAIGIGMIAIGYGMLGVFRDNIIALVLINVIIIVAFAFLIRTYHLKEERFKEIKKRFVDTQPTTRPEPMTVKKSL